MSIKIITDSASDISYELASEYDIDIMPIVIMKGDETYLDGVDISGKMIYDDMRQGAVYKTGAIAPNEYEEKFKEVLEKYDKAYMYLCRLACLLHITTLCLRRLRLV